MQILIDNADLARLSGAHRKTLLEIVDFLKSDRKSRGEGSKQWKGSLSVAAKKGVRKQRLGKIDVSQAADIMVNINDRATHVLGLVAKGGEVFDWKLVRRKYPDYEPGRFLAAVHRRLGTISKGGYRLVGRVESAGDTMVIHFAPESIAALKKAAAN